MAGKKNWLQKLNEKKEPTVKRIEFDFAGMPAKSTMLIATPQIIEQYISHIPQGRKVPVATLRNDLAMEHQADFTCPLTTGIFLRIVAEANHEKYRQQDSLKGITPFWRVIDPDSDLAGKLTFGRDFIVRQRKAEKIAT